VTGSENLKVKSRAKAEVEAEVEKSDKNLNLNLNLYWGLIKNFLYQNSDYQIFICKFATGF
jgi:hypothetical protein